jgi:hypothetical protein
LISTSQQRGPTFSAGKRSCQIKSLTRWGVTARKSAAV